MQSDLRRNIVDFLIVEDINEIFWDMCAAKLQKQNKKKNKKKKTQKKRHFQFHIPSTVHYPYPEMTMIAVKVFGRLYCAET